MAVNVMTFMRMLKLAIIHSSQRLNRDNNKRQLREWKMRESRRRPKKEQKKEKSGQQPTANNMPKKSPLLIRFLYF